MGKLLVFGGVSEFPARVKCATLAWHTFRAAIEEQPADGPVTTE
jgi:nitrogen fixation NifU-like protein